MARRFGRQWSAALAVILFLVTLSTYYALTPLRNAPTIVVEPESKAILGSLESTPPEVLGRPKEMLQDEKQAGSMVVETEKVDGQTQASGLGTSVVSKPPRPIPPKSPHPTELPEPPIPPEWSRPPEPPTPMINDSGDSRESTDEQAAEDQSEGRPTDKEGEEMEEEQPEPPPPTKALVMGKLSTEETDWVAAELSDWQNAIYVVDLAANETSPTGLRTKMNKAREAMPYLTYIVDTYPDFPDVVAFIHPHRRGMPVAWHNDARGNDAVNMMRDLRLGTVMDRGYVNLRCNNEVGCPNEVQPFRDPPDEDKFAEHAFPYFYGHFFNVTFSAMREEIPVVATQCCAQFAVSREQLLKLPKQEYVRYRTFLEETHYDDAVAGRVMEYMWHIIFGRDAVHCENMFECWCAVYGRCFGYARGGGVSGSSHHW